MKTRMERVAEEIVVAALQARRSLAVGPRWCMGALRS